MLQPLAKINGWSIYAHPQMMAQLTRLVTKVRELEKQNPAGYRQKAPTKLLASITTLMLKNIPADPTLDIYRQGDTLGKIHKHWFRAKFNQQYRLFFRYNVEKKIIVFAWVNDENTKRAYESKADAYRVFSKMLGDGDPPTDWDELLAQCVPPSAQSLVAEYLGVAVGEK